MKKSILLLLLLFLSVTPANAYLTIGGSSGLLVIPTTEVQRRGYFTLNYHNVGFSGSRLNFNYGITSNLELGISLTSEDQRQVVGPHIKGVFSIEEENETELAIGLTYLDFYAVGGSNLGFEEFKGYLGFGSGDLGGFFGGMSWKMDPIVVLGGEYLLPSRFFLEYSKEKIGLGLQMLWTDEIGVSIGFRDILGEEKTPILGLQFTTSF